MFFSGLSCNGSVTILFEEGACCSFDFNPVGDFRMYEALTLCVQTGCTLTLWQEAFGKWPWATGDDVISVVHVELCHRILPSA